MERIFVRDMLVPSVLKDYDAFGHCCNCFNTMGAGFARVAAEQFPELYAADQATERGDMDKLGSYSKASIVRPEFSIVGYNLYGQYAYSRYKPMLDYEALRLSLEALNEDMKGRRVLLPAIGGGLAGGSPLLIMRIAEEALKDRNATMCFLKV